MEYFVLWLCSIASNVGTLFFTVGTVGTVLYLLTWAFKSELDFDSGRPSSGWLVALVSCFFLGTIIPPTNDCYMIFGVGKTLQYVQSSKEAQKLPDNALKTINDLLEKVQTKTETTKNDSI